MSRRLGIRSSAAREAEIGRRLGPKAAPQTLHLALQMGGGLADRLRPRRDRRRALGQVADRAGTLFVSNERDHTVTLVHAGTLSVVKTIPVGRRPRGIVITPDGREVMVCAGDSDRLDVIDTESLRVVRSIPSGADPEALNILPSGATIHVANENDSMVTAIDRASGKPLAEIPAVRAELIQSNGIAFSGDGKTAFVALGRLPWGIAVKP